MRQKKWKRFFSFALAALMTLTMFGIPKVEVHAEESGVGGFVNRCYQVTLGRDADPSGYSDWTGQLLDGKSDGAFVAFGFVFSDEYTNAGKSNGEFVTDMYTLFLGRTPDEAGYNDWVGQLDAGADRQAIFAGFANSNEFFNICTSYGVTAGVHIPSYDRVQVNNVNMFVARMYRVCFNRLGDQSGQADWVNRLLSGELTGVDCARGFILSNEYQNLGLSNEEYVENMYLAFMGRGSDPTGFQDWVSKLKGGYTRDEIFAGFANSNEFQQICDSYGINRGTYVPQDVHDGDLPPHGYRMTKKTQYYGDYTIYSYNGNTDVPSSAIRYRADGSVIGPEGESYVYDGAGNVTKYDNIIYRTESSSSSIESEQHDTFSYDQNGNLTKEVSKRTTYHPDTNEPTTMVTTKEYRNRTANAYTVRESNESYNTVIDKDYKKIAGEYRVTEDRDPNTGFKTTYDWASDGRKMVERRYNMTDYETGKPKCTEETTYYFDAKGRTVKSVTKGDYNSSEVNTKYDAKGNVSESVSDYTNMDGSKSIYKQNYVYEYNGPGGKLSKMTKTSTNVLQNTTTSFRVVWRYEYDNQGHVTKWFVSNDKEPEELLRESYEYDAKGHCIVHTEYSTNREEFTYDAQGNNTKYVKYLVYNGSREFKNSYEMEYEAY